MDNPPVAVVARPAASRPKHGSKWDAAADAELRQRAEAGELLPAMARAMGRSQEALRTRANMLGIPVRSVAARSRPAPPLADG